MNQLSNIDNSEQVLYGLQSQAVEALSASVSIS